MRYVRFIAVLVTVALLSACVPRIRESNIIIPRAGDPIAAAVTTYENWNVTPVTVTRPGGATLKGNAFTRKDATHNVIYFGGNGFLLSKLYKHVLTPYKDLPVNVIVLDHRGYGASTGTGGFTELYQDATAIHDYVAAGAQGKIQQLPIIAHGHSLGSFIAGQLATKRKLAGLVLESSATTTEDWARGFGKVPGPMVKLFIDPKLRGQGNAAAVRTLDEPTLLIVGENDTTTRPAMSRALYDTATLPATRRKLIIVSGRGHSDSNLSPKFVEGLRWLLTQP